MKVNRIGSENPQRNILLECFKSMKQFVQKSKAKRIITFCFFCTCISFLPLFHEPFLCIFVYRVYLNYHTQRQVMCGALLGIMLAVPWFIATQVSATILCSYLSSCVLSKAGHETREFESCPKNSSLGYQNGLLDTRK